MFDSDSLTYFSIKELHPYVYITKHIIIGHINYQIPFIFNHNIWMFICDAPDVCKVYIHSKNKVDLYSNKKKMETPL